MLEHAARPTPDPSRRDSPRKGTTALPDALERVYREDHFARWLPTTRLTLLFGMCTLALFGLVDPWTPPRSWRSIVVIRSAGRLSPDELVALLGEVLSRIDRLVRAPRRGENHVDRRLVHGRARHPRRVPATAGSVADLAPRHDRDGESSPPGDGAWMWTSVSGSTRTGRRRRDRLDRFSYDLWGDTVNTASRMESHAAPGAIRTTVATYECLRDRYTLEGQATMDAKGKGRMPVLCLIGQRPVGPVIRAATLYVSISGVGPSTPSAS